MMSELVQDIRTEFRESPGIVAMVVFAIAIGIGFNAAIFWEADGDGLRMSASRAESIENQLSRLRSHDCTGVRKPGVTLIMGLRQYSVELSVPVPRVPSLFDEGWPDAANAPGSTIWTRGFRYSRSA